MRFDQIANMLTNERTEFVKRISNITVASEATVYRWISGEFYPSMARRKLIANELGKTVEELFPPKEGKK